MKSKDDFIDLPLHIKGKVIDFRERGRRVAPWDIQGSGQSNFGGLARLAGLAGAQQQTNPFLQNLTSLAAQQNAWLRLCR